MFELPLSKEARKRYGFRDPLWGAKDVAPSENYRSALRLVERMNRSRRAEGLERPALRAGELNAIGLIDQVLHYVSQAYQERVNPRVFQKALHWLIERLGERKVHNLLLSFAEHFPSREVYRGELSPEEYLLGEAEGYPNSALILEELFHIYLASSNPAFRPFNELFDDSELGAQTSYSEVISLLEEFFEKQAPFGREQKSFLKFLREPAESAPYSLTGQLLYIKDNWADLLPPAMFEQLLHRLLAALDYMREEEKHRAPGPGPAPVLEFGEDELELELYSPDLGWMRSVVLIARHTYVWLDQLSRKYKRSIRRLDEIPEEELEELAEWGFNAIWLIGIWERSPASRKIKRLMGNPEALASAYSIYSYTVADELGGNEAFDTLKDRASKYGIRLAVDIVPNHTGIYSEWILEHPDWYIQLDRPPFPSYTYTGPDLSDDPRVSIYIEDGYWDRRDAGVTFKWVSNETGEVRYIYHGNDGTSMPWNDTAQLNFLLPEVREAVMREIVRVAQMAPIVRFDAAMTLAKRHFQRLWFPPPGSGGDIPSRAGFSMSREEFNRLMPKEFWREVVERVKKQAPDTLLLAEAFWLMEGYFVRTLGMHRVYNSAFMNMLKNEENANYRTVMKNVLEFDPEILRRFVNFLSNPDEETPIEQFGKGDKYFGVCFMMVTLPGLPMFAHGQIEGLTEKYGMEYQKAYWQEEPDRDLIARHRREIFPLMRRRYLFSGTQSFLLHDFIEQSGYVNEDVFAYSSRFREERVIALYNNRHSTTRGRIDVSVPYAVSGGREKRLLRKSLVEGLGLSTEDGVYYIISEFFSGLEFIVSGKQLADGGLEVELGPYEKKLFWNFREVRESDGEPWGELLSRLSRRGVASVFDALEELRFERELNIFYELLSPSNIQLLLDGRLSVREFLDRWYALLPHEPEQLSFAQFRTLLETLISSRNIDTNRITLLLWALLLSLRQKEKLKLPESAVWRHTGEVLRELLGAGLSKQNLLLQILTSASDTLHSPRSIVQFLKRDDVQRFIRCHRFEGTVWFHKESFEELIDWVCECESLLARIKSLRLPEVVRSRVLRLKDLAEKSGYRYLHLIKALCCAEGCS